MSEVKGFFSEPLEPQRQPKNYDAWQAASLLVGLYGANAGDYADDRRYGCGRAVIGWRRELGI